MAKAARKKPGGRKAGLKQFVKDSLQPPPRAITPPSQKSSKKK
jgi:hypothetical protein